MITGKYYNMSGEGMAKYWVPVKVGTEHIYDNRYNYSIDINKESW